MSRFPGRVTLSFNPVKKRQRNLLTIKKDRDNNQFVVASSAAASFFDTGDNNGDRYSTDSRSQDGDHNGDERSRSPVMTDNVKGDEGTTTTTTTRDSNQTEGTNSIDTSEGKIVFEEPRKEDARENLLSKKQDNITTGLALFRNLIRKEKKLPQKPGTTTSTSNDNRQHQQASPSDTGAKKATKSWDLSDEDDDEPQNLDFEGFSKEEVEGRRAEILLTNETSPSLTTSSFEEESKQSQQSIVPADIPSAKVRGRPGRKPKVKDIPQTDDTSKTLLTSNIAPIVTTVDSAPTEASTALPSSTMTKATESASMTTKQPGKRGRKPRAQSTDISSLLRKGDTIVIGTSSSSPTKQRSKGRRPKKTSPTRLLSRCKKDQPLSMSSNRSLSIEIESPIPRVQDDSSPLLTDVLKSSPSSAQPSTSAAVTQYHSVKSPLDREERKRKRAELVAKALQSIQSQWKERIQRLHVGRTSSVMSPLAIEYSTPTNSRNGKQLLSSGSGNGILRQARLNVDDKTLKKIRTSKHLKPLSSDGSSRSSSTSSDGETSSDESSSGSRSSSESESSSSSGSDSEGNSSERESDVEINGDSNQPQKLYKKLGKAISVKSPKRSKEAIESSTKTKSKKTPGEIVCSICSVVKYYSHKQRRFGQYSCESCSKFFHNFLKEPKAYFCNGNGDCDISSVSKGSSEGNRRDRCRACWLKVCLQTYTFDEETRRSITENNFLPKLRSEPHVSLIAVDVKNTGGEKGIKNGIPSSSTLITNGEKSKGIKRKAISENLEISPKKTTKKQKAISSTSSAAPGLLMVAPLTSSRQPTVRPPSRGPRVKSVCRSTATGLPRATFSPSKGELNGSFDQESEDSVFEHEVDVPEELIDTSDSDAIPVTEYVARAYKIDLNSENSEKELEIAKGKGRKKKEKTTIITPGKGKFPGKPTARKLKAILSSQKSAKIIKSPKTKTNKKTVREGTPVKPRKIKKKKILGSKISPAKPVKTPSRIPKPTGGTSRKTPKKRCGECKGCKATDCGQCVFCKDKKKFGGQNIIKQACKYRKCTAIHGEISSGGGESLEGPPSASSLLSSE